MIISNDWFKINKNGNVETLNVLTTEDLCKAIKDTLDHAEEKINRTREDNKKLRDEHYKDNLVSELQCALDEAEKAMYHGFPISEKNWEDIHAWKSKHDSIHHNSEMGHRYTGAIGGSFIFEFCPTSIGTIGKCVCESCRKKALGDSAGDLEKYKELLKEYEVSYTFKEL